MGEIIRLLAIDDNAERISRISRQITKQDPEITIDCPPDFITLIQLIKTNSYDCIITPQEINELEIEPNQTTNNIIKLPIIKYNEETSPSNSNNLLAQRIKQTLDTKSNPGKVYLSPFPYTPKVLVNGQDIFILHENGSKEFWGSEIEGDIEEIASQMDLELRAVNWIKGEIERFIGDLTEALKYTDVPHEEIPNIVFEGYRSLLFSFKKIDESINTR